MDLYSVTGVVATTDAATTTSMDAMTTTAATAATINSQASTSTGDSTGNAHLSGGTIAGIVIGVLAALGIALGVGLWLGRRRNSHNVASQIPNVQGPASLDPSNQQHSPRKPWNLEAQYWTVKSELTPQNRFEMSVMREPVELDH